MSGRLPATKPTSSTPAVAALIRFPLTKKERRVERRYYKRLIALLDNARAKWHHFDKVF